MATNIVTFNCLRDLWHVAGSTLAAGAGFLMLRMSHKRSPWAIWRFRAVALQTHIIARLDQISSIRRSVDIVAVKTFNALGVHVRTNIVVALHAVLAGCSVGEMRKRGLTQLVIFHFPEITQFVTRLVANGPSIVTAIDGVGEWSAFGVALNADIIATNVIEPAWVDDIRLLRGTGMHATCAVALLAAYIPFGY